ncbi:hypothetical protein BDZ91DRAFT_718737 [Kalaharituber pfeilii]|nr:hypothetical protein BDZ91DRAFT_718737 [Kalaharituber pfeilii]
MSSPPEIIPVAAAALYNLLKALFTYIDEHIEPRNLGVVTVEKMKWVAERVGMMAEFAASLSLPPEDLAETYSDLECQYFIVPTQLSGGGQDAEHDYGFEVPDTPGLTKAGFVKMQALGLILESGGQGAGDMQYRFLQACISHFPLTYVDPVTHSKLSFPPLPPHQTVTWYVTTLARTVLGVDDPTPAGIQRRVAARRALAAQDVAGGNTASDPAGTQLPGGGYGGQMPVDMEKGHQQRLW